MLIEDSMKETTSKETTRMTKQNRSDVWVTRKQFNQLVEKIVDLGWDYDHMSSSGKQVYDEILTILGVQNDT